MKAVQLLIGRRQRCYHCGEEIVMVYIPAAYDTWKPADLFDSADTSVIQMHDCPRHPLRLNGELKRSPSTPST